MNEHVNNKAPSKFSELASQDILNIINSLLHISKPKGSGGAPGKTSSSQITMKGGFN